MTAATSSVDTGLTGSPGQDATARLAALQPALLRAAAQYTATLARSLTAASSGGRQAVGEVTRGWSARPPVLAIGRLLDAAEETADLLFAQSRAIEGVAATMERAQTNAHWDITLAAAQVRSLQHHGWADAAGAVVGVPALAHQVQIASVLDHLQHSLTGRLAEVQSAVDSLPTVLAADPTALPDALRAGPAALLPADPVANPAGRTDRRNRAAMEADLHSQDPVRMSFAFSILQSLQHAGDRGPAQLVVYDSTAFGGQGRAAIAVGDLTTATNVAVVVPGITNSPSSMSGGVDLAADLREEALRQAPQESTAAVAWYGYDIPVSWTKDPGGTLAGDVRDTVAAGSAVNASSGAPLLAGDLQAIRTMAGDSSRMTLLGFSMGATTVSEAGRYDLPVDAMVLLGSPGAGWDAATASDYRDVPESAVFVLSYDQDPVTLPITDRLAADTLHLPDPYGPDPASGAFGGQHIDAATNVPLLTGTGLLTSLRTVLGDPRHHSMKNYMQGAALAAEGAIVVGRGKDVKVRRGR